MIIKREYVSFGKLMKTDKEANKIITTVFNQSYDGTLDETHKKEQCGVLMTKCLYEKEMGWGLIDLGKLIDEFERLDEVSPYDNGYSYEDVNDVKILSKSENDISLLLVHKSYENYAIEEIVDIIVKQC